MAVSELKRAASEIRNSTLPRVGKRLYLSLLLAASLGTTAFLSGGCKAPYLPDSAPAAAPTSAAAPKPTNTSTLVVLTEAPSKPKPTATKLPLKPAPTLPVEKPIPALDDKLTDRSAEDWQVKYAPPNQQLKQIDDPNLVISAETKQPPITFPAKDDLIHGTVNKFESSLDDLLQQLHHPTIPIPILRRDTHINLARSNGSLVLEVTLPSKDKQRWSLDRLNPYGDPNTLMFVRFKTNTREPEQMYLLNLTHIIGTPSYKEILMAPLNY